MNRTIEKLIDTLAEAVETRSRPNLDDIDAANLLGLRMRDEDLLRECLEILSCHEDEEGWDAGHRCTHCDDYVDRNGTFRNVLKRRLGL